MKTLKELIAADVQDVFLNTDEFADKYDVEYDGEIYYDVSVVLTENLQAAPRSLNMGRAASERDELHGIYARNMLAHLDARDFPVRPERGQWITLTDRHPNGFSRRYRILESGLEMGMVVLTLEALDE